MDTNSHLVSETFQTFSRIDSTTSRSEKEAILKSQEDNTILKKLLYLTYNPHIQFYVKKMPEYSNDTESNKSQNYKEFLNLCNKLSNRQITGSTSLEEIKAFLSSCTEEEGFWYTRVLQKDLKIGVSDKTINKVYGKNFIPSFNCMLAQPLKNMNQLPEKFIVDPKLDGMRFFAFVDEKGVELKSRNGKIISGYNSLEKDLQHYLTPGYVYDGELMSPSFESHVLELKEKHESGVLEETDDVRVDNGAWRDLMTQAFRKEDGKVGVFNIFDRVPISEFTQGISTEPLLMRRLSLMEMMEDLTVPSLKFVEFKGIFEKDSELDIRAVNKIYDYYCAIGYEGIMIKDIKSPYQYKRTKSLLKLKPMEQLDLEVLRVEEGTGKYEDMLGLVVVDYKGYEVGVGSGFSDDERKRFWNNPNDIIGKTIQVQFQEETQNKNGEKSLLFPTYKGVRYDK